MRRRLSLSARIVSCSSGSERLNLPWEDAATCFYHPFPYFEKPGFHLLSILTESTMTLPTRRYKLDVSRGSAGVKTNHECADRQSVAIPRPANVVAQHRAASHGTTDQNDPQATGRRGRSLFRLLCNVYQRLSFLRPR